MAPVRPAAGSIEEAIGHALQLQRAGRRPEAEAAYRSVLQRAPDHPHALHFYGMCCHDGGRLEEAIAHLERAARLTPDDVYLRNNLGNLYMLAGRLDEAESATRQALALAPDAASIRFNLGVLLLGSKRFDEAAVELEASLSTAPDADGFRELGNAHVGAKRYEDAVKAFRKAVELRPDDPDLKARLCRAYFQAVDAIDRSLADPARAIIHLERWLELDPDDPIARHTLAAYTGRDVPARCSDGYVQRTFDLFAESFDNVLGKLGYSGVERSAHALGAALGNAAATPGSSVVLDAGCGTGALGPLVRPWCARLVGIDLSQKMVDKTRARQLYDEVVQGEIVSYLALRSAELDAIVCADTVIYFGDVGPLFAAAVAALKPGGHFIFTVEALPGAADDAPYHLDRHGRYAHREAYLEQAIASAGASIVAIDRLEAIRVEYGSKVPGAVFSARRPGGSG